jgi:hypothetical protein
MLGRVAIIRTDVSGESIASIIGVTRIDELGTTLAVTTTTTTTTTTITTTMHISSHHASVAIYC